MLSAAHLPTVFRYLRKKNRDWCKVLGIREKVVPIRVVNKRVGINR